jgi:hypothetical protein
MPNLRAEVRVRVARVRRAPAAPALVEENDPVGAGIEVPAHARGASGALAAVQDDRGFAVGIASDLPVNEVSVTDVEQPAVERLDLRVAPYHDFTFGICNSAVILRVDLRLLCRVARSSAILRLKPDDQGAE